jgi:hypothetical protein
MPAKEDEYGNARKQNTSARGSGPRPSVGRLRLDALYRGGVPYMPFRTGRRRGGVGDVKVQPFPDPPGSWTGTLPEWAINWAHLALGKVPFQDFQYQFTIDGVHYYDFFDFQERVAIEVQGLFWHYEFAKKAAINDQALKARTEIMGITLIFIDEDMALTDPIFYLREALSGRDHSRATTGGSI